MAVVGVSCLRRRMCAVLFAGVSMVSLTGCAVSSSAPETGAPSVIASPSPTREQSGTEAPLEPESGAPSEPTTPGGDAGEVVNADNAYEICLDLLETKSIGPDAVPGGYSRDKLAPEPESVVYQRQDGVFAVGIYGTEGDAWNPDRRDYLLSCYFEGPVRDPVWYDLGIGPSHEPDELRRQFEEYDIHAGA